ncbi:MAG: hypothetical protein J6L62_02040 [Clostridia bacterium]|nr:hypothetical protein [Clostridia bacterium]
MDLIIFAIVATVVLAFIIASIAAILQSLQKPSEPSETYQGIPLTDHARDKMTERYHITDQDIPLTDHARYKMTERYNITDPCEMDAFASNAFRYGKTYDQLSGYISKKLYNIQYRHGDVYTAKLFKKSVFIFTNDTNCLITVYEPDNPDFYH